MTTITTGLDPVAVAVNPVTNIITDNSNSVPASTQFSVISGYGVAP